MSAAKLFGNWLLCLSVVCWVVGCDTPEDDDLTDPTRTNPTMPTTAPLPDPDGDGEAEGEDEGEPEHDHADGDEDHDHEDGDDTHDHEDAPPPDADADIEIDVDADGDAQSSTDALEIPDTTADADDNELNLPTVEAGSTTGV